MDRRFLFIPFLLFFIYSSLTHAQNVAINNTGAPPDASAMLDVQSDSKGILVPRLNSLQRQGIANPATGLLVYDTDTESFWFNESSGWAELTNNAHGLRDNDKDTKVEVEQAPDDDIIRFFNGGNEFAKMDGKTLHLATESESVYIGLGAGRFDNSSTVRNVGVGEEVFYNNTDGFVNSALGFHSLRNNTEGSFNAATGFASLLLNTTGDLNSAFGHFALRANTTGSENTGIGQGANYANQTGDRNTMIGNRAGGTSTLHSKSGNVFIGYEAGFNDTTDNKLYIENSDSDNPLIYGEFDNDLVKINGRLSAMQGYADCDNDTRIDLEATADEDTIRLTAGGFQIARFDNKTLHLNAPGSSLFIGDRAGSSDDGSNNQNAFLGYQAGVDNTSGAFNCAVGHSALWNSVSGNENTAIGHAAASFNTQGNQNTVIGREANLFNQTGSKNTAIGYQAGRNTGSASFGNVFIGYRAGYSETGNNKLHIANTQIGDPLIYGEFDNDIVGINGFLGVGIQGPLRPLHIKADGPADSVQTIVAVLESGVSNRPVLLFSETDEADFDDGMSIEYNGATGTGSLNEMYVNGTNGSPIITFENSGEVGIGTTEPTVRLQVDGGSDVSLTGGGYFMTNSESSTNIAMDNNEIMARDNGAISTLYVQAEGGDFSVHDGLSQINEFIVKGDGKTGIGDNSPSDKLHVNADSGEDAFRVQVNASTKFRVFSNGGISFFSSSSAPSDGIFMNLGFKDLEFLPSSDDDFRILPSDFGFGELGSADYPFHEMHSNGFFGAVFPPSDRRLKEHFKPIDQPLDIIQSLEGLSYAFKAEYYNRGGRERDEFRRTHQLGMIAQDVEQVLPQLVHTNPDTGMKSLEYMGLIPVLVEAIKEQQRTIDDLQVKVAQLTSQY